MMKKLYVIPEGAQDFMEQPIVFARGTDIVIRFDYETEDGSYSYKGIVFRNCSQFEHKSESEIKYSDFREAYNSIAFNDGVYYIFFDGFGLYSFVASGYDLLTNPNLEEDDVML